MANALINVCVYISNKSTDIQFPKSNYKFVDGTYPNQNDDQGKTTC